MTIVTQHKAITLRDPFPPELIGKLPRLSCRACAEAQGRVCARHQRQPCGECGSTISSAHIHLDFVGHAAVTDRLLQVDDRWTWRPMATDDRGAPLMTADRSLLGPEDTIGMWIELTVCEVTRPGFGGGRNAKEAIGDALRNAAMRFGVGLDLWSRSDLRAANGRQEAEDPQDPPRSENPAIPPVVEAEAPTPTVKLVSAAQKRLLWARAKEAHGEFAEQAARSAIVQVTAQGSADRIPAEKLTLVLAAVEAWKAPEPFGPPADES